MVHGLLDGLVVDRTLGRDAADRLGLAADPGDVLMLQLFADAAPGWLLFFSGAVDGAAQARLAVYADLLRESLDAGYREAVEAARHAPPPATVRAYQAVYGHFPRGWPPEV